MKLQNNELLTTAMDAMRHYGCLDRHSLRATAKNTVSLGLVDAFLARRVGDGILAKTGRGCYKFATR